MERVCAVDGACPPSHRQPSPSSNSGSNPSTCGPGTGRADRNGNAANLRPRQPNHRHHTIVQPPMHSLDIVALPVAGILAACTALPRQRTSKIYVPASGRGLTFFRLVLVPTGPKTENSDGQKSDDWSIHVKPLSFVSNHRIP